MYVKDMCRYRLWVLGVIFFKSYLNNLVIKNDNIGNNPNLAIISSCASSYPYIKLENMVNSYNIGITSTDNFQLLLTKSDTTQIKLISNDYINNGISILNNSFFLNHFCPIITFCNFSL